MSEEKLSLSLKRNEREVELTSEDGVTKVYTIIEMTGMQRDLYISSVMKKGKFDADGKISPQGDISGLQASLISMCLYDNDHKLVPPSFIHAMPTTTQNALFEACSKINGLDKTAEDDSKNE